MGVVIKLVGKLAELFLGRRCEVSNRSLEHPIKLEAMSFADGTWSSRPLCRRSDLSFRLRPGESKSIRYDDYFLEDKMSGKYIVLFPCPEVNGVARGLADEDFGGANKICSPDICHCSAIQITSCNDGSLHAVGSARKTMNVAAILASQQEVGGDEVLNDTYKFPFSHSDRSFEGRTPLLMLLQNLLREDNEHSVFLSQAPT